MAASKAQKKNREAGKYSGPAKRQLALVGLAGLFLVVWGFVLGILVGRGMVPTLVEPKPRPAPVTVTPDGRGDPGRPGKIIAARADRPDNGSTGSGSADAGSAKPLNQSNLEFFDQLAKKSPTTAPRPQATTTTTAAPVVKATTATTMAKATQEIKKPDKKVEKKTAPAPTAAATKSKGDYTIQAAAFRSRSDATKYAAKISKTTGRKFVVVSGLSRGQLWHRVRLDSRMNRLEAVAMRKDLEIKGFKSPNVVRVK